MRGEDEHSFSLVSTTPPITSRRDQHRQGNHETMNERVVNHSMTLYRNDDRQAECLRIIEQALLLVNGINDLEDDDDDDIWVRDANKNQFKW